MTSEDYLRKMQDPLWYGEQDENGVDLSLIRSMLELTPTERVRRLDKARLDLMRLRQHGRIVADQRT